MQVAKLIEGYHLLDPEHNHDKVWAVAMVLDTDAEMIHVFTCWGKRGGFLQAKRDAWGSYNGSGQSYVRERIADIVRSKTKKGYKRIDWQDASYGIEYAIYSHYPNLTIMMEAA